VVETEEETSKAEEPLGVDGRPAESGTQSEITGCGKLVTAEKSAVGNIKFRCYYNYFTSAGFPVLFLALLFFVLSEGTIVIIFSKL